MFQPAKPSQKHEKKQHNTPNDMEKRGHHHPTSLVIYYMYPLNSSEIYMVCTPNMWKNNLVVLNVGNGWVAGGCWDYEIDS